MTARAKTLWLLALGAAVIAFVAIPFRFTAAVPLGIRGLTVPARAQLIERFEPPARSLHLRADSLRREIIAEFGGTTPTQDSLLREIRLKADEMLRITAHLRTPEKATFEEQNRDINLWLSTLLRDADHIARRLAEDYLH